MHSSYCLGVDPNGGEGDVTTLMVAAEREQIPLMQKLIKKGCDLDRKNKASGEYWNNLWDFHPMMYSTGSLHAKLSSVLLRCRSFEWVNHQRQWVRNGICMPVFHE
jgi:hypothetical protein